MDPSTSHSNASQAFAEYLASSVKLDALEQMTSSLDRELADSQLKLAGIKGMFDSIPKQAAVPDSGLRQEDLSKFLETGVPQLLMPDMEETYCDDDLSDVIASMKAYAESLKKTVTQSQASKLVLRGDMSDLQFEKYASSLDQLGKRLANIKLSKEHDSGGRNMELEAKLSQVCQDVNMFTQIIGAQSTLSEQSKNWVESQVENNSLYYDNLIIKLLSGINEVTYLMQNN